ncbi:barstar family protein [Streptomyces hirsutus]|uniref:barstar family protein n=1 Tax=Streptomyces hirsutus TaxID=35620 RepID=UPI0036A683F2
MTHERAGWLVVALDLDGATDKTGLLDRCARALDLPGWFGRNRDALADSLADHTVRPEGAVERGLPIVVDGRLPCATARPAE